MEINGKEISQELLDKAAKCETAEELLALARENGIELTAEQAEAYLSMSEDGEVTDAEMGAVAGGWVSRCLTQEDASWNKRQNEKRRRRRRRLSLDKENGIDLTAE